MKRILPLLLILCLLLPLAACGGTAPAPTPERTPEPAANAEPEKTEAPAPTETPVEQPRDDAPAATPAPASGTDLSPAAEYPILIPLGESCKADLDLDGTVEEVEVTLVPGEPDALRLRINGLDRTDELYAQVPSIDNPDTDYWAVTDVNDEDYALEIAIQDLGPSDDFCTHFYRMRRDGGIYWAGDVTGLIGTKTYDGDLRFDGHGTIHSYIRLRPLQTWYAYADFAETENGMDYTFRAEDFNREMPELSAFTVINPTHVRLLRDLMAYGSQYGRDAGEGMVIPAGVEMDLIACDNYCWIQARSDSEDWVLWFYVDPENPYQLEGPDGWVNAWDAMDGLLFAD